MAQRLYQTHNSKNQNNTFKYRINCQERVNSESDTSDWLQILSKIEHDSPGYKLFKGLLEKKNPIVVKIGPPILQKEFEYGDLLEELGLPTFIRFYCIFNCLDNFNSITNSTKSLCKKEGYKITVLVMPNIKLGSIGSYPWTRENFPMLKNIVKHCILSLFYAYEKLHFLHRDFHLGNILLKKTQRTEITYGDISLETFGYIPVIMDFDKSILQEGVPFVYDDIIHFIGLLHSSMPDIRLDSYTIVQTLTKFIKTNTPITHIIISQLLNEIDNFTIRYFTSEIIMPNWLKSKSSYN